MAASAPPARAAWAWAARAGPFRVLFAGREMHFGYEYTAEALAQDAPGIEAREGRVKGRSGAPPARWLRSRALPLALRAGGGQQCRPTPG